MNNWFISDDTEDPDNGRNRADQHQDSDPDSWFPSLEWWLGWGHKIRYCLWEYNFNFYGNQYFYYVE